MRAFRHKEALRSLPAEARSDAVGVVAASSSDPDFAVVLSPDSQRVAFQSDREGDRAKELKQRVPVR